MRKLCITLLLLMSVSYSAIAKPTWHSDKITRVYPLGEGGFVITFANNSPSCTNTSQSKYHYVAVGQNGVTEEGIKFLYSAALTAAASGKTVDINFDASSSSCYINRLSVNF